MTGSLAQAHTLALSGVTDDDIDTLLTSNKLGGFEGLGAERTGLAVPRASLPNGVALPGDTLSATITQRNALYESIAQRRGAGRPHSRTDCQRPVDNATDTQAGESGDH